MTTAAFPSWVTFSARQEGYSEKRETNIAKFQPDIGPAKLRRRTSMSNVVIPVSGWVTSDDWDSLDNFYKSTLYDGTLPFTWTHPRTAQAGTFQFEGDPPFIAQVVGIQYLIQFSVRVLSLTGTAPGLIPALKFNRATNSQYLGAL